MESKLYKPQLGEIKKMALNGDKKAAMRLAIAYMRGNGVNVDQIEAAKWYLKAAEQCSDSELNQLQYL